LHEFSATQRIQTAAPSGAVRAALITPARSQMPTFFLDIEAVPTSAVANASNVADASVLTFVIADSRIEAEAMARSAIIDHAWIARDISLFLQLTEEHLSRVDANIYSAYEEALEYGIGCLFMVSPTEDGALDSPIEFSSFCAPMFGSNREH
jgi:hypothetical protein